MKLGTKLTLYLTLVISVVLSAYGYFHVTSRRDMLLQKTEVEVLSIGYTLKYSLEEVSALREKESVQNLIDSVDKKNERTLGVIVRYPKDNLLFSSRSLDIGVDQFITLLNKSATENRSEQELGVYKQEPILAYTFPLHDRAGSTTGWVAIVQHMSFVEEEIRKAKWTVFLSILLLIATTEALLLLILRKWLSLPVAQLLAGIKQMAKGRLETRIDIKGGSELSELAGAFNEMAVDLKSAQERMIQETETKMALERHLRHSEKLATIGQLASELAHEIGTPLNIIGGRAELARRQLEDRATTLKNLRVILEQSEKITRTIQQFLGFARKKSPEQISVDIPPLVESMLDLLSQQFEKQDIRIVKDMGENLPAVKGDPDHMQQVFLNLMFNAVQAMPEGGTMNLTASTKWASQDGRKEKQSLCVEVCVMDTGIGMDREVLKKIFDPFFTTKHQGTGLGLTVAHGIVQEHKGWISVESQVGKGSVFRVCLPVLTED